MNFSLSLILFYIDWFDKQCQVNDASGFSTHVFSQYRDVIEHKHDRILFVDNKNPDDAVDEEEEAYKIQNKVQKDHEIIFTNSSTFSMNP